MGKLLGLVARAQSYHLRGVGDPSHAAYGMSLDGIQTPAYDFSAPGAVAEVKRALSALAQKESVTAQDLLADDVWDDAAAIEFAIFVGRHRSRMPWALTDPFVMDGPYPSKPQPTAWGLELLAGAVNTELDDPSVKLSTYEAWRNGVYAPPSVISRPPQSAGLRPTYNFSPHTFLPADATPDVAAAIGLFDTLLKALIGRALVLTTEDDRATVKNAFLKSSQDRESAVAATIESSAANTQAAADCTAGGGAWQADTGVCVLQRAPIAPLTTTTSSETDPTTAGALILLGLGAGALYLVFKR